MKLKKLATIALFILFLCQSAIAADTKLILCVNGSSQVFARPKCLAAEKPVQPIVTPTPTPTPAPGALNLNTCRKISVSAAANVGVATASFQCDINKEFVFEYGFTTSDGNNTDASVKRQELLYTSKGTLPVGVVVTMEGSRTRFYNLNLTATCCKK